jgi:hypothetical protein
MFIGHFALGFAVKRAAPRLSIAALFAAAQLADIIWPFLVALGIEQVRIDPGNTAFTPLDFTGEGTEAFAKEQGGIDTTGMARLRRRGREANDHVHSQ